MIRSSFAFTLLVLSFLAASPARAQASFTVCDSLGAQAHCSQVDITTLGGRSLASERVTNPGALLVLPSQRQAELALQPGASSQMCLAANEVPLMRHSALVAISDGKGQDFARIELQNVNLAGAFYGTVPVWLLRNAATGERFLQLRPQFESALALVPGLQDTSLMLDAAGQLGGDPLSRNSGAARTLVEAILGAGSTLIAGAPVSVGPATTLPALWSAADVAGTLDAFRTAYTGGTFPPPIASLTCDNGSGTYLSCTQADELGAAGAAISALTGKYVATSSDATFAELLRGYKGWAQANALLTWTNFNPADLTQTDLRFKYIPNNAITLPLLHGWSLVRLDARTPAADRDAVDAWMHALAAKMSEPYTGNPAWTNNNHGLLQASVGMSHAAIYGDDAAWRRGLTWFAHALQVMRTDGSLPYEIERGACGMQYQNTALASLVYMAALADRQGFDLFTVVEQGRSLDKAVGFLLDAVQNNALADQYRVEGTVCNHPAGDPQHLELVRGGFGMSGQTVAYSAWTEHYLRRFPNHPRRAELLSLLASGTAASRPLMSPLTGGASSCVAATTFDASAEALFDLAEQRYPWLFAPAGQRSGALAGYQYRYYPGTGNHVGVSNGQVYFLPAGSGAPLGVGTVEGLLEALR